MHGLALSGSLSQWRELIHLSLQVYVTQLCPTSNLPYYCHLTYLKTLPFKSTVLRPTYIPFKTNALIIKIINLKNVFKEIAMTKIAKSETPRLKVKKKKHPSSLISIQEPASPGWRLSALTHHPSPLHSSPFTPCLHRTMRG